jgi:hypothetical protein
VAEALQALVRQAGRGKSASDQAAAETDERTPAERRASMSRALADALAEWDGLPAPSLEAIEGDRYLRQLTDQSLSASSSCRTLIGERLVRATLGWLAEPFEPWPMRDRLDRLEKLGFVDVAHWLRWRENPQPPRARVP